MARSQTKPAQTENAPKGRLVKRRLDELNAARVARHLVMFRPDEAMIADVMVKARQSISGLADTAEVVKVARHNPDFMLALTRRSTLDPAAPVAEGLITFLPLNLMGMQHLALGTFNTAVPELRLLAKPHERPAGIYLWMVYAPGTLGPGVALMMEKLSAGYFAGTDIYVRPATEDGRRFSQSVGFTQGITVGELDAPDVWVFKRPRPLYDSYAPGAAKGVIGITVAHTFEDLSRVIAIRSAVYIGEQECPYEEEYDGNDLAATHLLAYIGDEPVGCLRVRCFADFAKIERLAIRKEFRKTRAAFHLVRAGFKLCQKKGYTKVYGHSQKRLVNFWSRFGFRVPDNARHFVFSDFDYVEIVADIERDPDAVNLQADPYVIIRPEGRWHQPGVLEKSADRAVTRPSVENH